MIVNGVTLPDIPAEVLEQYPYSETPEAEYAERYSILGSILVGTARQIMRLTDSTEKVKPEEFEPKLEGINIQLQELTVTATEEVQTITPPSGVYGFSKVIVEAVEDSGGTGGGGTGEGGEGGEDGDQILSGDYVGFGNEYVEEEVPTGYCEYTSVYGQVGYMVPSPVEGAYIIASLDSGGISKMGVSSEPYTYTSRISTSAAKQKLYQHDASKGTAAWEYVGEFVTWNGGSVNWTNHDIYDSNGTLIYAKCPDPVPETVVTTVKKPVEYDAEYKISGESLNNIITLAQDVTGTKEPMTLDEAYAALDKHFNPEPTE